MKKILFTLFLFFIVFNASAQSDDDVEIKKHEIKINIGYLLAGIPEISYEYLIDEESGVGIDLFYSVVGNPDLFFGLTPHYRFYFGNDVASGFFAEGFGMLNTYKMENYFNNYEETNETDFALGVSIGGKFVTNSDFIFEIYAGVGRNLFNSRTEEFVPRAGLTFGKRF